jgi:hypothetical protein
VFIRWRTYFSPKENKKPKKSLYHLTEVNKTKKNEAKREDIAKQICCHAQRVLWQQMG